MEMQVTPKSQNDLGKEKLASKLTIKRPSTCNLRSWKAETGRLPVQGHPALHSKFQANLSHLVRLYLKKIKKAWHSVLHL
jgi:hypothetical protein